jgi:outer membrane protein assembly factor BamB
MKRLIVLITVIALAIPLFSESPSWPRWRGPNGDGTSRETGWNPKALEGGAKVLWNIDIGFGYSNIVIQDGRLYAIGEVQDKGNILSCLDAAEGTLIWQRELKSWGIPHATPALDGERVYLLGQKGFLSCLNASDGRVLWEKDLVPAFHLEGTRYGWVGSPVVHGELVLINGSQAGIALDKQTGDAVWVTETDTTGKYARRVDGSFATPVVCTLNGTPCVLFINDSALIAVEIEKGKTLWSYLDTVSYHPVLDPIVLGTKVLYYGAIQLECAGAEPSVRWESDAVCNDISNPVLVDGYLYGYLWDYTQVAPYYNWQAMQRIKMFFRCVDWNTGEVKWETMISGGVSLIAADRMLIMLELNGTLRIAKASPAGYEELATADALRGAKRPRLFPTHPVLCDGRIYCRNFAGDLVCIDVSR